VEHTFRLQPDGRLKSFNNGDLVAVSDRGMSGNFMHISTDGNVSTFELSYNFSFRDIVYDSTNNTLILLNIGNSIFVIKLGEDPENITPSYILQDLPGWSSVNATTIAYNPTARTLLVTGNDSTTFIAAAIISL
jgi:hypothetical protein